MQKALAVLVLAGMMLCMPLGLQLPGTWVIYAGGTVAPAVLQFEKDGTGRAWDLPEDYDEVWLQGLTVPEEYLFSPVSFTWHQETENGKTYLTIITEKVNRYVLTFFENLDGTGLPGFSLQREDGSGGGWVKVQRKGENYADRL